MVGGKILLANGDLQEAGSIIWADGTAVGYGRGDNPDRPQYQFRRPVDYCSGVFLFTPRRLFLELGGFRPLYSPLITKMRITACKCGKKDLRVIYEPRAVIQHYESASSGGNEAAQGLMAINQQKFVGEWKDALPQALAEFRQQRATCAHLRELARSQNPLHRGPNPTPVPWSWISSQQ